MKLPFSYSTAISNLSERDSSLSCSLARLKRIEAELKDYLACLQHEHGLAAQ